MPRDVRGAIGKMMAEAWHGALEADVAVLVVDAARRLAEAERSLARDFSTHFTNDRTKKLLVLNKMDLLRDRTDMYATLLRSLGAVCACNV